MQGIKMVSCFFYANQRKWHRNDLLLRLKRKITHATIGIAYSFPYFQHP